MTNKIKSYKKEFDISYATGAYVVIEMLKSKPKFVEAVFIHSDFVDNCGLEDLCRKNKIPVIYSDKEFRLISQRGNCYVFGVFRKYKAALLRSKPHVVLVNPFDMGNLGTIIRTAAGFNINNVAIIMPSADIFNPKTIRASMGAVFRLNFQLFDNFDEYAKTYREHNLFSFMTDGAISPDECEPCLFSLIFGSETAGLDKAFENIGQSVKIPVTGNVDSLNLSIAAGIGMYVFAMKNKHMC